MSAQVANKQPSAKHLSMVLIRKINLFSLTFTLYYLQSLVPTYEINLFL